MHVTGMSWVTYSYVKMPPMWRETKKLFPKPLFAKHPTSLLSLNYIAGSFRQLDPPTNQLSQIK